MCARLGESHVVFIVDCAGCAVRHIRSVVVMNYFPQHIRSHMSARSVARLLGNYLDIYAYYTVHTSLYTFVLHLDHDNRFQRCDRHGTLGSL